MVFHRKLPKTTFRLQATSEKWGKLCFGASRKVEIQKNNVSGCPDELFFVKMNRRGVPKPEKSEKRVLGVPRNMKTMKKTPVVGRRNTEIAKKCSSSADEMQKSPGNARRRPTKRENCRETPVVGRRNVEIVKICSSSVDEMQKLRKYARRRPTKREKHRKPSVIHG